MPTLMQLLVSLLILAHTTTCEFTNPGTQNEVLILGQPLNVTYRGIKYHNYSIALWQQFPKGGGAILGPAIYETRGYPSSGFAWVVQLYDFDLDYSDRFFFWLFEGDYSNQGYPSEVGSMVSGYFIISTSKTSASPSPSPSATATSTTTTAAATATATSQTSATPTPLGGQGLSTHAKIGIALGAFAAGLALIVAVGFFLRYRCQKKGTRPGNSVFYSTPYCSPVHPDTDFLYKSQAPGTELLYKSHVMASQAPPRVMTHMSGSHPAQYGRQVNREPVEMGI
ncbi:hypothetical protein A9K55_007068 [Cordyceps militaris]|uniref:Uncharacterized protein n=1 Tax=Cordyceps militaris TaxID=73501 RepID=A0A2H4SIX2_CORMI|nr:hypothetical protein A9K55_007068 [Cordyceps militaris]